MKRSADSVGESQEEERTLTSTSVGAPTSSKSQKSAGGDSPSKKACNANGFEMSLHILRSVLHHGLGFPLACYLHSDEVFLEARVRCPELVRQLAPPPRDHPPQHPQLQQHQQQHQQQPPPPPRRGDFDTLLKDSCVDWLLRAGVGGKQPQETALTSDLSKRIKHVLVRHRMTAHHSRSISTQEGQTVRPDILVREAANFHPVLMIEVGLSNSDWWQKMDQILKYLVGLRDRDNKFMQPVLLTVLTIATDGCCVFTGARIGTFLVTCTKSSPTRTKDFRLAMLRRVETSDLNLLSAELAKVVRAACLLPSWVAASRQPPMDENSRHEYLGPNCRRVGNKVFRAYDNRLIYTDRRPDLYERIRSGNSQVGGVVFEFADANEPLLPFGEHVEGCDQRDWFWAFRGRCRIYATTYHVGQHVAWSALDFIPVVDHLLQLHRMGLVHGDIRCSNIVFGGPDGCLIDFDFGGEVNPANGTPKYPSGFNFQVPDGSRRGSVGGAIWMRDDWYALKGVMFTIHEFLPPGSEGVMNSPWWKRGWRVLNSAVFTLREPSWRRKLLMFANQYAPDNLVEIEAHAKDLKDFLSAADAAGWIVAPDPAVVQKLASWGMDVARPPAVDSGANAAPRRGPRLSSLPATGSPPKDV